MQKPATRSTRPTRSIRPWHMAAFGLIWYYWMVVIFYPDVVDTGFSLRVLNPLVAIICFVICTFLRLHFKKRIISLPIFVIAAIVLSVTTSFAFFGGTQLLMFGFMQVSSVFCSAGLSVCLFAFFELLESYRLEDMRFSLGTSITFGLILYFICMIINSINLTAFGVTETIFALVTIPLFWFSLRRAPHATHHSDVMAEETSFRTSVGRVMVIMILFGFLAGMSELGLSSDIALSGSWAPLIAILAMIISILFIRRHNRVSDILSWFKVSVIAGSLGVMLQLVSFEYSDLSVLVILPSYICFVSSMLIFFATIVHYQSRLDTPVLLATALTSVSIGLAIGFLIRGYLQSIVLIVLLFIIASIFIIAAAFFFNKHTLFPVEQASKPLEMDVRDNYVRCVQIAEEHGLTPRQNEVFIALVQGKRVNEIADELVVSPGTVRGHINLIYEKLGVHSHAEMIALVREMPAKEIG